MWDSLQWEFVIRKGSKLVLSVYSGATFVGVTEFNDEDIRLAAARNVDTEVFENIYF